MKLHILSDIHLEYCDWPTGINLNQIDADVTVLAGDIGCGIQGVEWAKTINRPVLYVMGNHEFYNGHLPEVTKAIRAAAHGTNVIVLDNDSVVIDDVKFFGTTLWTDFRLFGQSQKDAMVRAAQYMSDFRCISMGTGKLTPAQTVGMHQESLRWLNAELNAPFAGKKVLLTHHGLSLRSIAKQYQDDIVSAAFASHLDRLVAKFDLAVHGHLHNNLDYWIKDTRVICNPGGYITMSGPENPHFLPDLVVEI